MGKVVLDTSSDSTSGDRSDENVVEVSVSHSSDRAEEASSPLVVRSPLLTKCPSRG